jgi:hypothetical protein
MRLRQVALVAGELEPVRQQLFTLLGVDNDFTDPGVGEFGLRNSVMAVGDTFLEIVSPKTEGTTAERLIQRRGGDGGYMVLAQVDDIKVVAERMEELNIRQIWNVDRQAVTAFHVHPKDMGAAIVSFDEMRPAEDWLWGGPDWRQQKARLAQSIIGCDIQAEDPERLAQQWSAAFDREAALMGDRFTMSLDDGSAIHFVEAVDGRGDGVAALQIASQNIGSIEQAANVLGLGWNNDSVELCGVVIRFKAALT